MNNPNRCSAFQRREIQIYAETSWFSHSFSHCIATVQLEHALQPKANPSTIVGLTKANVKSNRIRSTVLEQIRTE